MFKKVLNTKGFWKSVFSLGLAFAVIFTLIKWAIEGFETAFFQEQNILKFIATLILSGFVYGFLITFGKFRSRLKKDDPPK